MLLLYSVLDKISRLSCKVLNFLCVDFVLQAIVKIWISTRIIQELTMKSHN